MKHRARNIEALRLHFEEHLPRIVAKTSSWRTKINRLQYVHALPESGPFVAFARRYVGAGI